MHTSDFHVGELKHTKKLITVKSTAYMLISCALLQRQKNQKTSLFYHQFMNIFP